MRYPCLGFPLCLKTFENGYVLRGHQLSCEHAKKQVENQNKIQEHARAVQFDYDISGLKGNKICPTFTGLDNTQKLHFRDRGPLGAPTSLQYRSLQKQANPSLVTPQTKSTALDLSGYYT